VDVVNEFLSFIDAQNSGRLVALSKLVLTAGQIKKKSKWSRHMAVA